MLNNGQPRSSLSPSFVLGLALVFAGFGGACRPRSSAPADPGLAAYGRFEVTARLTEIPDGAIFKRDLYDYATVLRYEILKVHRGQISNQVIYVGHYNPFKPRAEAADRRVQGVGGDLRQFQAGQVHRLALDAPIDDHFMGGIVNKYFGRHTEPIYWALWTNVAQE